MRVMTDCDGVIADWDTQARDILLDGLELNVPESTSWDFMEKHIGQYAWDWLWREGVMRGLFRDMPTYVENIEALQNCSHDIVIVTKVPPEARIDRLEWLCQQYIPQIKEIHLLGKGESKAFVACDAYIDDYEENVYQIAAAHPTKLVALLDRPWNQGALLSADNTVRVSSVQEFLDLLDKKS